MGWERGRRVYILQLMSSRVIEVVHVKNIAARFDLQCVEGDAFSADFLVEDFGAV